MDIIELHRSIDLRKLLKDDYDRFLEDAAKTTAYGVPLADYSREDVLVLWMMDRRHVARELADQAHRVEMRDKIDELLRERDQEEMFKQMKREAFGEISTQHKNNHE